MEEITTSHGWKPANNGIDQLVQDFATIHCEEQIWKLLFLYMGVPHWSSILIGLCIINHPFFGRFPILGTPIFRIQSNRNPVDRRGMAQSCMPGCWVLGPSAPAPCFDVPKKDGER
jgi:hypothetical protein